MPVSSWSLRRRDGSGDRERACRAVPLAREELLVDLVRQGAKALLEAAEADRAGLWLLQDGRGVSATGCVVELNPGPLPEEWKHLDLAMPPLRAAMAGHNSPRVEFVAGGVGGEVGPLIGMCSVVWVPLRARGRTVGLAMAAHVRSPGRVDLDAIRAWADGIAQAALNDWNSRRIEQAEEETRAKSQLARAILCGVSVDFILPQITRTARQYSHAGLLTLGMGSAPPAVAEGLVGISASETFPSHEILVRLWRKAFQDGRASEISVEEAARLSVDASSGVHSIASRVVALPIEGRRGTRGVLVAGFLSAEDFKENFARLESYALLAASAIDRETEREERSAATEILGRTLEDKARLDAEMSVLLDSIESGVLLLDADGRILRASGRLAAILGLESRRLLECVTIHALIEKLAPQFLRPAETMARWCEQFRQNAEESWDEFELARPTRKIVERFAKTLFTPDGRRIGSLEVFRDITGQRLIQSKLLQTEKMAALGQLVSGIAHELNNPLTSIQGYAQLLLGRRSGPDREGDALRISQEAERAARIVKNLLLFSREAKSERRAVRLNEVIERTVALRSYELKLENIDVELSLDPGLPQTLADAAQLQQVVLNLIVNAEQAIVMARGDDTRDGRILIRTERLAGDRLALRISDDGPGIAPEIAPRIFDPFFTTKPPGVGTGLGLSIVYGIVQEHGGEIGVDSLPGRGATISIELPALSIPGFEFAREESIRGRTGERRPARIVSLPVAEPAPARERILIVEDEPTVAELIADVLSEEGFRIDTLLDSREARDRLDDQTYSLVICDLKMPYLDGPGLYRALVRRDNPMQHRLLFVTGDTMAARTIEFLKSSGLPYLAKPFLVEELKEAAGNALSAIRAHDDDADRAHAAAREP